MEQTHGQAPFIEKSGKDGPLDIMNQVGKNEFVVVVTNETQYPTILSETLKNAKKYDFKICYICLNKTYDDAMDEMKKVDISTDNFIFVDTLSSHYQVRKDTENCFFVSSPCAMDEIHNAIIKSIDEKKCKLIIFDTISTLLIYKESQDILKFTNRLMMEIKKKMDGIIYIYVILEIDVLKDENRKLISDFYMFAEKMLDFTSILYSSSK
jgi:archaellum biogenesis ATPase FlaH